MIPTTTEISLDTLEETTYPSKDYKMIADEEIVRGTCDGLDSIKQSVFKIINTERYDNIIYSWNYGIETKDLFGKPMTYVKPEIKRRIEEALLQDDRITMVGDFEFEVKGSSLLCMFSVTCDYGTFNAEREVNV